MKTSGIISRLQFSSKSYLAAEYTYRLDKEKLTDYSLEQQASILADYWLLLVYGISKWSYYQRPGRMGMYRGVDKLQDVPSLYQKIVTGKGC